MVRLVHTIIILVFLFCVSLGVLACRDIDDPPPEPVFDPNGLVDGGADGDADGGMADFVNSSNAYAHPS